MIQESERSEVEKDQSLLWLSLSRVESKFEYSCMTYNFLGVCQDTIAVAEDLRCLTAYIEGLRKKLQRKKNGTKGANVMAAYNIRRTLSEQGLKPNEVGKAAQRKRRT